MPTEIPQLAPNLAQPALRFAVVSDDGDQRAHAQRILFQSALRFAVVSDEAVFEALVIDLQGVSIRFKVRGGFRPEAQRVYVFQVLFQSALRFAVVSDVLVSGMMTSALGFNPL